jgi:hypothetical protein
VQNAFGDPRVTSPEETKRHLPLKRPFWLSLDLSTPIFQFEHLDIEDFFRNWLGLGQSTPIFFSASNTWTFFNCFAHKNLHIGAAEQFNRFYFWKHRQQLFGIRSEFGPFSDHFRTIFGPFSDHFRTIFWPLTLEHFHCFAHKNLHIEAAKHFHQFCSFPLAEHWSSYYCEHLSTIQTLTSFTVETFNIYFEDLMWLFTHLWRLDKQDRRLKISLS